MLSPSARSPLQKAAVTGLLAVLLLLCGGVRHRLVWGGSLHVVLDVFETACVVGFAWFGARAWLGGMAAVRERSPGPRRLLVSSLPLLVVAVLAPPFLSQDFLDYVMRGRVLALHGGNPYVQVAADFPGDPFLAFGDAGWKQFPLPYGPLVADLQGAIAWFAHRFSFLSPLAECILACALFKLVFAGCLVLCAHVARGIAALLRPADADVVFVGTLWNPLLLNEGVVQAHNELLVLLTLLLAVRASLAMRMAASGFWLCMGILTKIIPVLLAPLLLVWSLRHRRLAALLVGAIGASLVLGVYYLRFFAEPGSLDFLRRQSEVTQVSFVWIASELAGADVKTCLLAGRVLVVALVLGAAMRLWRRPEPDVLVWTCAGCLAGLVCFGLAGFGPWYHIWWIPLALLRERGFLHRFARLATICSPLGYLVWTATRSYAPPHELVGFSMAVLLPAVAAACWRPHAPLTSGPVSG